MILFKSCPRCGLGDVVPDEEGCGKCLQCGHRQYPAAQRVAADGLTQFSRIAEGDRRAVIAVG